MAIGFGMMALTAAAQTSRSHSRTVFRVDGVTTAFCAHCPEIDRRVGGKAIRGASSIHRLCIQIAFAQLKGQIDGVSSRTQANKAGRRSVYQPTHFDEHIET